MPEEQNRTVQQVLVVGQPLSKHSKKYKNITSPTQTENGSDMHSLVTGNVNGNIISKHLLLHYFHAQYMCTT